LFLLELAVLLHDVGDSKLTKSGLDENAELVTAFLQTQQLDEKSIHDIVYITSNMSFSKSKNQKEITKSIEFQIMQDADRLEAL
jgi:uncharacterized protein